MIEETRRLVLRFDGSNNRGQFSFRYFDDTAEIADLYEFAHLLNAFQSCNVDRVLQARVFKV